MLLAALGVGVFAAYIKMTPASQRVADDIRRPAVESPSNTVKHPPLVRPHHGPNVDVVTTQKGEYKLPQIDGDKVTLGPSAGQVPDGENPIVFLTSGTLKVLKIEGARAIGVDLKGRNAIIDLNPEFEKGYGSTEEGTLIKAMQTALGQIGEIDTFQFSVDGKVLDTLGQVDLSEPIPVIRDGKEVTPSSSPATGETKPDAGQDPASQG